MVWGVLQSINPSSNHLNLKVPEHLNRSVKVRRPTRGFPHEFSITASLPVKCHQKSEVTCDLLFIKPLGKSQGYLCKPDSQLHSRNLSWVEEKAFFSVFLRVRLRCEYHSSHMTQGEKYLEICSPSIPISWHKTSAQFEILFLVMKWKLLRMRQRQADKISALTELIP